KTIEKKCQITIPAIKSHRNGQQNSTKIDKKIPNNDTKAKESPPTTKNNEKSDTSDENYQYEQ
ncbi:17796_t:CDS:2, partial [Gigaspora margarita]